MSDAVRPPVFSSDLPGDPGSDSGPGAFSHPDPDRDRDSALDRDSDPARSAAERRRGARYGISLACVVLGVYLLLQWQLGPLLSMGVVSPLLVLQVLLMLAIGVLVLAGGLAIAPASPLRTEPMVLLALVVVPLAAAVLYFRITGALPGRPVWLWNLITPGTAALAVAILGWLVVRGRPALSYVLVIVALLPAVVRFGLLLAGVESSFIWFTDLALSFVAGVGAAWLAAGGTRMTRSTPPA